MGMKEGNSTILFAFGNGLGANVKHIAGDPAYLQNAKALRKAIYGFMPLDKVWSLASSLEAASVQNLFKEGDNYDWTTLNSRLYYQLNQNIALQVELTLQKMNIDAKGYYSNGRASGDFGKFTIAPTLKPFSADVFGRPEIRIFASYIDWSKGLNNFSTNNYLNQGSFSSGKWYFGTQMEIWF